LVFAFPPLSAAE